MKLKEMLRNERLIEVVAACPTGDEILRDCEELRPSLLRWPGFVNHAVWLKGFEDKGEGDVVDDVFEPGGGFPLHNDIANIPALGNRP